MTKCFDPTPAEFFWFKEGSMRYPVISEHLWGFGIAAQALGELYQLHWRSIARTSSMIFAVANRHNGTL